MIRERVPNQGAISRHRLITEYDTFVLMNKYDANDVYLYKKILRTVNTYVIFDTVMIIRLMLNCLVQQKVLVFLMKIITLLLQIMLQSLVTLHMIKSHILIEWINMENKFKNKTLVHQVIEALWNPMDIDYVYDRYENGMSVEDIIATDFIVMKKVVLRTFSHQYHLCITVHNNMIRRKKYEL